MAHVPALFLLFLYGIQYFATLTQPTQPTPPLICLLHYFCSVAVFVSVAAFYFIFIITKIDSILSLPF